MLSEVLLSGPTESRAKREPGISISGFFPCPYALFKIYRGEDQGEITPQQQLLMEDGWYQEEQTVQKLKSRGIFVDLRQHEVEVGKARIKGHIDGAVTMNNIMRLFEHKAMSGERFSRLKEKGLDAFPGMKAQIQPYMLGLRKQGFPIDETNFFAKHKDSCEPYDFIEEFDEKYTKELIDWVDAIVLEGWEPKPVLSKLCAYCGVRCFGEVLDLSWISRVSSPEMAEKWKKGKQLIGVGEMMVDEARTYFIGKKDKYDNVLVEGIIGDKDVLLVEDLEVRKITQHRFTISKEKVLKEFGPGGLVKVGEDSTIIMYRVREV